MQERPPFTLREAFVHRRWLMLAIVSFFVLAAGVLSLRPPVYEATALIYLDTSRTAPGFDLGIATGELLQHDFIVLGTSRPVLQQVCASPGVQCSASELAAPEVTLAKQIGITTYSGTSSIAVAAKAPTGAGAAALANAVALAMIDHDRAEVTRLFSPTVDSAKQQVSDLQSAIDKEQQQLAKAPAGSSAALGHQAQLAGLEAQYAGALTREQTVVSQAEQTANVATVQQSALPPSKPNTPDPPRYLLAALAAGACVAALAALLAERFDDRIRTAEGLARATGVPVAVMADNAPGRGRSLPSQSPYTIAFASLLAHQSDSSPVLVTAASAADHSHAVADGLGAAAARAGQRVFVVQSDGQTRDAGRKSPNEIAGVTRIAVPSDGGHGAAQVVADVRKQFDFESSNLLLVVALPSPDASPTALVLGRTAKRAVITATAGVTRFNDARRTADLLRSSGAELTAGVLLSRPCGLR